MVAESPEPAAMVVDPLDELELLDDERRIAAAVREAGGGLPDVGHELTGPQGRCMAEAQLAWPALQVAVLLGAEPADVRAFEDAGWHVFTEANDEAEIVHAVSAQERS